MGYVRARAVRRQRLAVGARRAPAHSIKRVRHRVAAPVDHVRPCWNGHQFEGGSLAGKDCSPHSWTTSVPRSGMIGLIAISAPWLTSARVGHGRDRGPFAPRRGWNRAFCCMTTPLHILLHHHDAVARLRGRRLRAADFSPCTCRTSANAPRAGSEDGNCTEGRLQRGIEESTGCCRRDYGPDPVRHQHRLVTARPPVEGRS
jgi:hypothetical protein